MSERIEETMAGQEPDGKPGISPHDTYLSSGLRFAVELLAWIAAPWGAAVLAGAWWVGLPVAVFLVGLPAVFSTPGDKQKVVVPTPGPARLAIEVLLSAVAVAGAWVAWPAWAAVLVTVIVALAAFAGLPRSRWLLAGAPAVDGHPSGRRDLQTQ